MPSSQRYAGAMRGASARMVISTLAMMPPRAESSRPPSAGICEDEAPFHCGSLGGKCVPISPSPMAPRMASVSACIAASASEWPFSRCVMGNFDAAQHHAIASFELVEIDALADANIQPRLGICPCSQDSDLPRAISSAVVSLRFSAAPAITAHLDTSIFGDRRIIREVPACLARCGLGVGARMASKSKPCGVCTDHRLAAVHRALDQCRRAPA